MCDRRTGAAFSLIELMVVVAVIGVLVTVALPSFKTYLARARQAEAKHNLGNIKSLQKSYNLRWSGFGHDDVWYYGMLGGNGTQQNTCRTSDTKNALGFRLEDCGKARYTYDVATGETWSYGRAFNNGKGQWLIYMGCKDKEDTQYSCKEKAGACARAEAGDLYTVTDVVQHCN